VEGLGLAFLAAVQDGVDAIARWPQSGSPVPEVEGLVIRRRRVDRFLEPPSVSWALHIGVMNAVRELGLAAPPVRHLASVDNLYVVQSVVRFSGLSVQAIANGAS
jgi:hypothetical protein